MIADFLSILGKEKSDTGAAAGQSNRSLSRLASEALGVLAASQKPMDKKEHRRLLRKIQNSGDESMYGKGDVFSLSDRKSINTALEKRNAAICKTYFPGRKRLFPIVSTKDMEMATPPGSPEELALFQDVMRKILASAE